MKKDNANRKQRRRLLDRVLISGRSRFQTVVATTALVFGLVLLLGSLNIAIGIYKATRHDGGTHSEYLIVNKRVSIGAMLTTMRPTFSEREIDDLRAQPFVVDVGEFETSRFRVFLAADPAVSAAAAASGEERNSDAIGIDMPLYTDLFFESVPDRFLDIVPRDWNWTPDAKHVPIILSREFLNLYNFSFALAQGLPQIPESLVGAVVGSVTISGPNGERTLRARVVGLSDRIPSIIVPASFMRWGHDQVSRARQERPSRLIVKTGRPADSAMLDYFSIHDYQVNSERLRAGQFGRMAFVALSVVGGVGTLFVLLALLLFVLLYRVRLAEIAPRIGLLLQLGYSPSLLAAHTLRRFWISVSIVAVVTAGILAIVFPLGYRRLSDLGFDFGPPLAPATLLAGLAVLALATLANWVSIRHAIAASSDDKS